jgi:ketoreductase RED1
MATHSMPVKAEFPGTVAVIGTGTISLGWIVLFLANGLRVRVNSRRPDAEAYVRDAMRLLAPALPDGNADAAELMTRAEFEPDLELAVTDVDVVQEGAPESLSLKQELFSRIERAARADTLLLSSTSTLSPDDMADGLARPGRLLVGHPFNPPHVIPLVEVVTGKHADADVLERAVAFYRSVGKQPVVIRQPVLGFVANRLQSALLQEAIHLVLEGVITAADLDDAVTASIGLRWAAIGPFLAAHLAGGPGGFRHWMEHIGAGLEHGWRALGHPSVDAETVRQLTAQIDEGYGHRRYDDLVTERDQRQGAILAALGSTGQSSVSPPHGYAQAAPGRR